MTTMEDLHARIHEYQRIIEDLVIKIQKETDPNGLVIFINTIGLVNEFSKIMEILINARKRWDENPCSALLVACPLDKEE